MHSLLEILKYQAFSDCATLNNEIELLFEFNSIPFCFFLSFAFITFVISSYLFEIFIKKSCHSPIRTIAK